MEGREGENNAGVAAKAAVESVRLEIPSQGDGMTAAASFGLAISTPAAAAPPTVAAAPPPVAAAPPPDAAVPPLDLASPPPESAAQPVASAVVAGTTASVGLAVTSMKKKRGRPRKYAPDGSLVRPLNPMPISASLVAGEYTPAAAVGAAMKRSRGRPGGFVRKQQFGFALESAGEMVACSAGANFTPHVITVAAGEDVTSKIISFSQQGPRTICILSANGVISNVTLRQPDSSGGTLTYEGRFELLSLSGSFMPSENGGSRSRSGGISVSLASADGRVIGGGVAGLLVAASPVQVVVGSFLPSYQLEQKAKKPKLDTGSISTSTPTPTAAIPNYSTEMDGTYGSGQGQNSSAPPKLSFTSSSLKGESWPSLQSVPDSRSSASEINISVSGG
ncbi:AT-hook motif nuclear-localized protein 7-like [Typha angustifolia]|uniref:AT-hook motif nuclear-localized protein 7-like n=1 Tax=Typha angustifolia TaxID=59011 RepID=UPI003C2E71AB